MKYKTTGNDAADIKKAVIAKNKIGKLRVIFITAGKITNIIEFDCKDALTRTNRLSNHITNNLNTYHHYLQIEDVIEGFNHD